MKLLLSADSATGQLFLLCFEPNCVFEVMPKHGGEWTLKFLFGTEILHGKTRALIEKEAWRILANEN